MIRVLSRTVRAVVVLVSLGAGLTPLGCKLATRDNPAVCDEEHGDFCATPLICVNHICKGMGGGGESGKGGAIGSGGAGGGVALGSGGGGGAAGAGGAGDLDGGAPDAPVDMTGDQIDPTDAPVDKPTCTPSLCPKGNPYCNSEGQCVECTTDLNCSLSFPVCNPATNKCQGCIETSCSTRPMTPVCDPASGACVACNMQSDCKDPTTRFCRTSEHVCVACLASTDCPAPTPICDPMMHTCGKCSTDTQCATLSDTRTLHCDANAGVCVGCVTSAQCTADPTKPICVNNACAPCMSDQQCKGIGPGVCMFHQDGRCATDAETLYVQKITGCAMTAGGGAGSSAMPFCLPQTAVDSAMASTAKRLIVLRGGAPLANFSAAPALTELSVIGQSDAQISPGAFVGIHLTVGSLYVRGVTVFNGTDIGIKADENSTLRLDRVYSYNNALGGLVLAKAGFDVVNSVFANNGPGVVGAAGFGGVYIGAPPTGMPARFAFNTIVNNADKGVACESMQAVSALLLYNNTTGDSINCAVSGSKTGDPMFQPGTNNYHLSATSPCRNFAMGIQSPLDDYEGNARPSEMVPDCGAFEFVPTTP